MAREWVPLHLHTVYSNFDGTIGVQALVEWAQKHSVSAAAVTDHGVMSAVPSFSRAAAVGGIKPIFGCELYCDPVLPNPEGARPAHHLIALAANQTGYRNLLKLLSFGHRENYYRKPRVTIEKIEEYSEGILFSSACIAGELPSLLLRKDTAGAREFLSRIQKACRGNFFIELMDTGDRDLRQMAMNESLYALAKDTGTRMTFTCDAHYFAGEEVWYPHILAVNKGTTLADMKAASVKAASEYDDNDISIYDLSLRSPEDMWSRWGNKYGEALAGTMAVASMVETYEIAPESYYMPTIDEPGRKPLAELAREGLSGKLSALAGLRTAPAGDYRERLEYELSMVSRMGFNDYFLMVHEMVDWAKNSGIFVGPGRGSAAGSLLAWSLGITSVDPIRHNLYFERFLNPERVSMPDIDVDFEDERRGEVIEHLKERYGEKAVCGIIGYSQSKWKSSLRDASRTLGYGAGDGDLGGMFASAVKGFIDSEGLDSPRGLLPETLAELVKEGIARNKRLAGKEADLLKIASLAQKFLSLVRHYTRHASGIVIAPPEVTDHCPLYNLKGTGDVVVQYDMDGVEMMKLVKMDILGLSNLTLMKNIYRTSRKLDPATPSPDELYSFLDTTGENMAEGVETGPFASLITKNSVEHTLEILKDGDTTGVFQLFSPGMRRLLRNIKPDDMDALSSLIALYRPGPLASGMTRSYEDVCKGRDDEGSPFPEGIDALVADVTKDSRGIVIYQEQVMKIAQLLGGYSLGEADMLRRAMGKKKASVMEAERERFISRCMERGLSEEDAGATFDVLAHFAGYGFNKSHSTAYAYVAFATAWYKANREAAFWGAYLDLKSAHEKKEDMVPYIRECMRKWRLNPPTLLAGDSSLADSSVCRIMRNGREMGELFPEYEDLGHVNELLWREPAYWSIYLGATQLGGMSGTKMEALDSGGIGKQRDFCELLKHLVLDGEGCRVNPKHAAQLALAGVFDRLLAGIAMTDMGVEKAPSGGKQKMLFGVGSEKGISGEGYIPENFVLKGAVPVPVLRSVLIYMEEEMDLDPVLRGFVEDSLIRLLKKGTDIRKRLMDTDRNRFLAWVSLLVTRIRSKTALTKNPWGEEEVDRALVPVARTLRYMAWKAQEKECATFTDPSVRLSVLRSLYRRDAMEFSDGLSVPSWVLASEMVGWSAAGYVDELDVFQRTGESFRNTPWGKSMDDTGLWFIGYAERLYTKDGKTSLIASGRWGSGIKNYFLDLPDSVNMPKFITGECMALRMKCARKGYWSRWEIQEVHPLSLMVPDEGIERVKFLNCGVGEAVLRIAEGLPPDVERDMRSYLSAAYSKEYPGKESVTFACAPTEISDPDRTVFKTELTGGKEACIAPGGMGIV